MKWKNTQDLYQNIITFKKIGYQDSVRPKVASFLVDCNRAKQVVILDTWDKNIYSAERSISSLPQTQWSKP